MKHDGQNIFDNQKFFDGYRELRENPDNANILEEKPALFELCPDLTNKSILDLGCGYGENCMELYRRGAKNVIGIDISEKMLKIARDENPNIEFIKMDMNNILSLKGKFDIVISSLAVHYIKDFNKLVISVYELLNSNGHFIFSQEHPLTTAPIGGAAWVENGNGETLHYKLTDYSRSGERRTHWIVDDILKYHRTFSELINTLIENNFIIERLIETVPSSEVIKRLPHYERDLHKPNFLLVRTKRLG